MKPENPLLTASSSVHLRLLDEPLTLVPNTSEEIKWVHLLNAASFIITNVEKQ